MNPEGLPGCASGLFGTMPHHPVPKMVNSQICKAFKPLAIQSCTGSGKLPVVPHLDSCILHDRMLYHFEGLRYIFEFYQYMDETSPIVIDEQFHVDVKHIK